MDYNEYSFIDLKKEYDNDNNNKAISWYIKNSNPTIKAVFEEENKELDAYIYCTNMPDRLNRFIFKGKILSVEPNNKESEQDKKFRDYNTKVIISDIFVYKEKYASKLAIRNSSETPFCPRNTYGELNSKVIDKIKNIPCKGDLKVFLKKYTECSCEFEKKNIQNAKLKHTTFKKDNEDNYVEFHHIIQRKFGYDDPELLNKLDTCSDNYAKLCPACHRAIHYGKKELRKEMLDILIKKKKSKLEELYNDCLKNSSFKKKTKDYPKGFKEFIYKTYDINE